MGEINLSLGRRRIAAYGITLKSPKRLERRGGEQPQNIHEQSQDYIIQFTKSNPVRILV